ncbi:hypothetical protein BVC80_1831g108 [Macleaya cordata]|uniref:Uncharacterized protein n=1 Tax=Macleaya cordata TaxID=56857 RepID=A0A200R770_MACCD|nr:hypothetical protein BVC80_1831g108 [Macleaya cordata]
METPSSTTRRVTRSQTKAAAAAAINSSITMSMSMSMSKKNEKVKSKQRNEKRDRSTALIDVTNGSPIVGVAMGNLKTPSSTRAMKKKKDRPILTPSSGESLLRGQVKTLLQKKIQEEEDETTDELPEFSFGVHPLFFHLQKVVDSPPPFRVFRAPTPANTPQVLNFSSSNGDIKEINVTPTDHQVKEDFRITQEEKMMMMMVRMDGSTQAGSLESQKSLITRSLLFEFSNYEKSETASSDHLSSSSVCSNNVLTNRDQEEIKSNDHEEEEEQRDFEEGGGGDDDTSGELIMIDELCEEVRQISVNNNERRIPGFVVGNKHIRFVYNSEDDDDDEIEIREDESDEEGQRD